MDDRGSVPPQTFPEDVDVHVQLVDEDGSIGGWHLPDPRITTGGLVFLILLAFLLVWLLDKLRDHLPDKGILPRTIGVALLALRVALLVMGIMIVSRLLPEWLRPGLLLAGGAVALALGAGAIALLLPDVVGGILVLTEGRLRRGLWIRGDGFTGTIVRIGPRSTLLRAADGTQIAVPNRRLVKSTIEATDRRWHEVEVILDIRTDALAKAVRSAIEETVLCSPFVPVEPELLVTRDPAQPSRWRVKARILSEGFEERFRGQLLERVEDALPADEA
ncbi:MAG: mechanosensitive ion channel [Sandaracinaceae bacterium]